MARTNIARCALASVLLLSDSFRSVRGTGSGLERSRLGEKLIFSEEFDEFDLRTWSHEITASGGGNWEFEWYGNNRANNSYVENGTLFLRASLSEDFLGVPPTRDQTVLQPGGAFPNQCSDSNDWGCRRQTGGANIINPVQSAKISTKESFSFRYGRVEVRAKMPQGDWLWPAIWLMPRYAQYGGWPASGEIDLVESRGNLGSPEASGRETMSSTLHWGPKYSENMYSMTHKEFSLKNGADLSEDFHTYGMYWNSSVLYTYLDNATNVVLSVDLSVDSWTKGDFKNKFGDPVNPWRSGSSAAPFDREFFLIMNLACGGTSIIPTPMH